MHSTGSAAIHGLRGKRNINVFILYPKGRVSDIQEKQMTTVLDKNVHCICLEGVSEAVRPRREDKRKHSEEQCCRRVGQSVGRGEGRWTRS